MLVDEWVVNERTKQTNSVVISEPGRSPKTTENMVTSYTKFHQQRGIPRMQKPPTVTQDKFDYGDEMSVQAKVEASKKRIQDGYRRVEDERKRRKMKVVDLKDIPNQEFDHKHPFVTPPISSTPASLRLLCSTDRGPSYTESVVGSPSNNARSPSSTSGAPSS